MNLELVQDLDHEFSQLQEAWQNLRQGWRDQAARHFELEVMEPLIECCPKLIESAEKLVDAISA